MSIFIILMFFSFLKSPLGRSSNAPGAGRPGEDKLWLSEEKFRAMSTSVVPMVSYGGVHGPHMSPSARLMFRWFFLDPTWQLPWVCPLMSFDCAAATVGSDQALASCLQDVLKQEQYKKIISQANLTREWGPLGPGWSRYFESDARQSKPVKIDA